jgi:hypothetical protein
MWPDYESLLTASPPQASSVPEEIETVVTEGSVFYDRLMAHGPANRGCEYLFGD